MERDHQDIRSCMQAPTRICVLVVTLLCAAATAPVPAQDDSIAPAREYKVKGVFVYSFGRFVHWPAVQPSDEFVIGILGDSPIDVTLDRVAMKKQLKGRRIKIQRFDRPDLLEPCQILFISRSVTTDDEAAALLALRGKGVLVVGETEGFIARGGCIGFHIDGSSVRFRINVLVAQTEGLQFDAKLLKIGNVVEVPIPARS